jgi:ferredoxin-like protein FixX
VNNTTKVKIICKEHGVFEQSPKMHIHSKQGCPECGKNFCRELCKERQIGTEEFIRRSIEIHGNRYDYSLVNYIRGDKKVDIICPDHGVFEQNAYSHSVIGQGCYECGRKLVKGKGGYTIEWIENQPEDIQNQSSLLYVIEMKHKSLKEHFIKVGITTQTIKERFSKSGVGDKYIDKKELFIIPKTLVECIRLENKILEDMKDFRYYPNFVFSGYTECFKPKKQVIGYIKELINE